MRMYDIINAKKNCRPLSKNQIEFWIKGVCDKTIPDYQTTALLMAILLNGMNDDEIFYMTSSMLHSGDIVDLSNINGIKVDKHSTGGVGDSTSFVVLPIISTVGLKVAKMSGRALGHTGGTLDKLDSFKGFRTELTESEFANQVNNIGLSIIGQSKNICPADKIIYSLRDVTATVDSIPLIASSIMSKKIAGGADIMVLDVKCGNGAFLKDIDTATKLGTKMVDIAKMFNKKASAVITNMNQPLDNYIGNSLEILGAIKVLQGEKNDLYEVSVALTKQLIFDSGICKNLDEIDLMIKNAIDSGRALEKLKEMISYQGGNIEKFNNLTFIDTKYTAEVKSKSNGYINAIETENLGNISSKLGAGRLTVNDKIDYNVGMKINKKIGDKIEIGENLVTVYYNDSNKFNEKEIVNSFKISKNLVKKPQNIYKIIK